jgi:hypothetical protein
VLSVEFHGYHSQDWAALPVTLPSQWYGFDLVRRVVRRGAVIVICGARGTGGSPVPALGHHRFAFTTITARSASVGPGNLSRTAFQEIIAAVQ